MAIDIPVSLKDDFTRQYNQIIGGVTKSAGSIDSTMKSIGGAIGAAFSVAAIGSFMKTAAEANAGVAKLDQALANSSMSQYREEILGASDALSAKTAVDDDEITKLQSLLVGYTGNIDAVRQLTPAILDLAAGTGMSVDQAAKLVARSQEGAEGLKRLGIVIGDTSSEEERLAKITQEVTARYGGMAEAFGNTDAGGIQKLGNAMEDLQESVGNVFLEVLMPALPGVLAMFDAIGWSVGKIVDTLKVLVTGIMTTLVIPLAAVEKGMNALGLTSSKVFQNMFASGFRQSQEAIDGLFGRTEETAKAVGRVGAAGSETSAEIKTMSDKIKDLSAELAKLEPGTKAYTTTLQRLNETKREYNSLVAKSELAARGVIEIDEKTGEIKAKTADKMVIAGTKISKVYDNIKLKTVEVAEANTNMIDKIMSDFEFGQDAISTISMSTYQAIGSGMQQIFAGAAGGVGGLLNTVGNMIITTVEGLLVAAAAAGKAWGVITFGVSLVKDIALLAGGIALLETARGILNRSTPQFHEGGTMGSAGQRIPFAPDERPAILRVGETVRTKEQEAALRSGGGSSATVNININGNGLNPGDVKRAVEEGMRQTGLFVEQYFINPNVGMRKAAVVTGTVGAGLVFNPPGT